MNMRESSSTANWFPSFLDATVGARVKPRREAACPSPWRLTKCWMIVAVRVTKKTRPETDGGIAKPDLTVIPPNRSVR